MVRIEFRLLEKRKGKKRSEEETFILPFRAELPENRHRSDINKSECSHYGVIMAGNWRAADTPRRARHSATAFIFDQPASTRFLPTPLHNKSALIEPEITAKWTIEET